MENNILIQTGVAVDTEIAVEYGITREKFYEEYVSKNRPVILKGLMDDWPAKHIWGNQYFSNLDHDQKILAKKGNIKKGDMRSMKLSEYVALMQEYEYSDKTEDPTHYLHDFPMFQVMPDLADDVAPFPLQLFPKWYADKWWNYCCFFIGTSRNKTPMHIDTLLTNNLFFQVAGVKEFTLILAEDMDKCYRYDWKWSRVNPDKPDYVKYPKFKDAKVYRFQVTGGDILYMPAGAFHQVKSITNSISFNIDWHTKKTVLKGLWASIKGGASFPNIYYNSILALGLCLNIPSKYLFKFYKSYFAFIA
ncbi:cupin-like domain-containing protein [Aureisphaera galaxeae]|uniref:cupin-like domain-containing protein n=1 Tax=Aureisphaera galaxeae TaxID=1538023 RepID=UPI0023509FCF|nr:cupin-like domain-containing protein [Aureisphaera galaxeae]MDC8004727.1 cupin-like domain-containing protein [Aureisphaera galaxeae]